MLSFVMPNPSMEELKRFQIEHYTETMNNPRSFKQKIFLRKQLYQFKTANDENASFNLPGAAIRGNGTRVAFTGHDAGDDNFFNNNQVFSLV